MIRVKHKDCDLRVTGHAGAGEAGKDTVCAAVSGIMWALAANVEGQPQAQIRMEKGDARISCRPSETARWMFDFARKGLQLLERSYGQHIRVE